MPLHFRRSSERKRRADQRLKKVNHAPNGMIRYADLFSGIGAVHVALDQINTGLGQPVFQCVFACDIDASARRVYETNHGIRPDGDINDINLDSMPEIDMLAAGFPCVTFSVGGSMKGFDDKERGQLFFSVLRVVDAKRPTSLFLENVPNLLTIDGGSCFRRIVDELEQRGYHVTYQIINPTCYTPQRRDRLMILADLRGPYMWPAQERQPPLAVRSILDDVVPGMDEVSRVDPQRYDLRPVPSPQRRRHAMPCRTYDVIVRSTGRGGGQGQRVYSVDAPGPTICSRSGGVGRSTGLYDVDGDIRSLTVSETKRMFGFPDDFDLGQVPRFKAQQLLGNSIVVPAARAVLECLLQPP
jgi:DNA (cytosine-5)-methyltransferase 1